MKDDGNSVPRTLILIEDDAAFARTLGRSFERRDYTVLSTNSLEGAQSILEHHSPGYAVVDLKLDGEASGLACVQALHERDPDMLIVVLTGYASIATAVEAVKLGARSSAVIKFEHCPVVLNAPALTKNIKSNRPRNMGKSHRSIQQYIYIYI